MYSDSKVVAEYIKDFITQSGIGNPVIKNYSDELKDRKNIEKLMTVLGFKCLELKGLSNPIKYNRITDSKVPWLIEYDYGKDKIDIGFVRVLSKKQRNNTVTFLTHEKKLISVSDEKFLYNIQRIYYYDSIITQKARIVA